MVSGFSRHPEDNRYKHVTPSLLTAYCLALEAQPDLSEPEALAEIQQVLAVLESGELMGEAMISQWQVISTSRGNGNIRERLIKSRESIRL